MLSFSSPEQGENVRKMVKKKEAIWKPGRKLCFGTMTFRLLNSEAINHYCWCNCKLVQPLWKSVWRILKRPKINLPFFGIFPKDLSPTLLTQACSLLLFKTASKWKQRKCPSADEWIMKMWCMHTVEFHPAIKKNEMKLADKWLNLENILSDIAQIQKEKCHIFSLICVS